LTIDSRPNRAKYIPPIGSISLPLVRDPKTGLYLAYMSLNGGSPHAFVIDTGTPAEVLVPQAELCKIAGANPLSDPGQVTATARLGTDQIDTVVYMHPPSMNLPPLLGMSFLGRFRTVIDYRDLMLYLEKAT
jgi:hypothetical protein